MVKKILSIILSSSILLIAVIITILVSILMILDFFGANVTDNYVENNLEYAEKYIKVLNKNIKRGKGYVSLSRILYFYLEDDSFTFDEIYEDNLEDNKQRPISDVCSMKKYSSLSVCSTSEIEDSNQIDEDILKPFNSPLDIEKMNVTSFFKQERIIYDREDIHEAWDFSSPNQTSIYSVCDGEVVQVSFKYDKNVIDKSGGGGNQIKIRCEIDDDITYEVLYAHLYPKSNKVKVGQKITSWQEIASVGTTGYSTGPHLHYQVSLNGETVDGMSLIDFTKLKEH